MAIPRKFPVHDVPVPETVGRCPECGGDVLEGTKNFYCYDCASSQERGFLITKNVFSKLKKDRIDATEMRSLLNGELITFKGLVSHKTGESFDCKAALMWFKDKGFWGIKFVYSPDDMNEVLRNCAFRKRELGKR